MKIKELVNLLEIYHPDLPVYTQKIDLDGEGVDEPVSINAINIAEGKVYDARLAEPVRCITMSLYHLNIEPFASNPLLTVSKFLETVKEAVANGAKTANGKIDDALEIDESTVYFGEEPNYYEVFEAEAIPAEGKAAMMILKCQ